MSAGKKLTHLGRSEWAKLIETVDTVLFDADGVLWNGNEPIQGSAEAVNLCVKLGKRVFMVTNNSTKSRESYVSKTAKLGFHDFKKENIVTTSAVAAQYVSKLGIQGRAYVVGSKGIGDELAAHGVKYTGLGPDLFSDYTDQELLTNVPLENDIGCVVAGFDGHFSYPKLMKAASYLRDPTIPLVVTNTDNTVPSANPELVIPGTGSIIVSIVEASGRKPAIMGKPCAPMFEYVQSVAGGTLAPERTLMVGDRSRTDVKFANDNGLHSLFVLSGDTQLNAMEEHERKGELDLVAEFYTQTLGDILKLG